MVYPALLPLMRTPRLPVVDWPDAPADLNGLVRFAERRSLVSARVPSHFKRSLPRFTLFNQFWRYEQEQERTPQTGVDYTYFPNAFFTVLRASFALMFIIACSRTKIIYFYCVMDYLI